MPPGRFLPPPPGGSFYALPLVVEEQHGGLEFLERIGEAVGVRGNDLVAGDVRDPCHAAGQADGVRAPGAGVEHHPGGVRGKDDIRICVDVDARRPVEAEASEKPAFSRGVLPICVRAPHAKCSLQGPSETWLPRRFRP